jgi:putative oxidoreductase
MVQSISDVFYSGAHLGDEVFFLLCLSKSRKNRVGTPMLSFLYKAPGKRAICREKGRTAHQPIPACALNRVVIAREKQKDSKRREAEDAYGKGAHLLKAISSLAPLILRVTLGAIFLLHGINKFEQINHVSQLLTQIGIPFAEYAAPGLALLEVVGGVCLILGIGTRIFASLLAIVMAIALFKVKLSQGLQGGYELELVLLVTLISLILSGAGALALGGRHRENNREHKGVPKQDFPRRPQLQ